MLIYRPKLKSSLFITGMVTTLKSEILSHTVANNSVAVKIMTTNFISTQNLSLYACMVKQFY